MSYKIRSLFLILIIFIACPAISQQGYRQPPAEIIELADAPQTPAYSISPDKKFIAFLERREYPPIQDIAKPELRLAGIRIDPSTNGISKPAYFTGITFMEISTGKEINPAGLPDRLKIRHVDWSPDSKYISFTLTRDNGIELWIIDIINFNASRLTSASLNEIMGKPYSWISNGNEILVKLVNPHRGLLPAKPSVPDGPVVQENTGKIAPARTYQDLLKNEFDETLFDYYAGLRLAITDLNANIKFIGETGIFNDAVPSPDGKFILTEKIIKPYSYLVPYYYFPAHFEVIDKTGNIIAKLTELPLADDIPVTFGSVRKGKRIWGWRNDASSELFYVIAQDSGDASRKTNVRDKIFLMKDPFDKQPVELASTEYRYRSIHWGNAVKAVLNEYWWSTRRYKTSLLNPSIPGETKALFERSTEDAYNDPGSFVLEKNSYGEFVLKLYEGKFAFLSGRGSSPDGDMPFLDRMNLDDLTSERLWRSSPSYFEDLIEVLDKNGERILISKESAASPPNLYIENLNIKTGTALTNYENPYKSLQGITKEIIQYSREDGVQLNAVLYLPAGYAPSRGRMPVLMWAYPQEFKSSDAAGQVRGSEHRFVRLHWGSPLYWLTQGYVILDNPSMPIIGEGDKEPNDTYIEQLVMNAKAAIDELVKRGIADPQRIAIGGHSYGAFMTANLLAHSDLFAAGIARSGAYNRTLTPFGFQAEERTIWQSPETYINMSPFMFAHKINEPVLIIHGMEDSNSGTYPIQSERLYNALKGHGATARLVMLPFEDHHYQSRESVLHILAEQHDWLEKYVKNKR